MLKEITLYEMKHDGTDREVRSTLRAWEVGDVTINTTYKFSSSLIVVTAEATCALQGDRKIFNNVGFARITIVGIMNDGRLECIGKPIRDPDPEYDNLKSKRNFRFYLLITKGVKMIPDPN